MYINANLLDERVYQFKLKSRYRAWELADNPVVYRARRCCSWLLRRTSNPWYENSAGTALRGTNVKSQMLSFQIFTGLRAISPLQINGAIGNERGSARATAITASWYHKSRLPHIPRPYEVRYLTHTLARAHIRSRYYQCGCGDAGRRRLRRLPVCQE